MEDLMKLGNLIPMLVVVMVIFSLLRRKREKENNKKSEWQIDVVGLIGILTSNPLLLIAMALASAFIFINGKQG